MQAAQSSIGGAVLEPPRWLFRYAVSEDVIDLRLRILQKCIANLRALLPMASSDSEKILRAKLRRNYAFSHRHHFLLSESILEAKQSRYELLRIAKRNQTFIGQHRV